MEKTVEKTNTYFLKSLDGKGVAERIAAAEELIQSLQGRVKKWEALALELDPGKKPAPVEDEKEDDACQESN